MQSSLEHGKQRLEMYAAMAFRAEARLLTGEKSPQALLDAMLAFEFLEVFLSFG